MNELSTGTSLKNRYTILSLLGSGGFGYVYKAADNLLNRFVAIKSSEHPLGHEIRILNTLKNVPYISHIYDSFTEDGCSYIVMRLVGGKSLTEYKKELGKNLSPADIKMFLPYICMTLSQMHHLGIIHRDISPGNLLVTPENSLYLIDFGTATSIKRGGPKNHLLFSHKGLDAPERTNEELLGPATDIYSLCATIVYLMSGEGIPLYTDRVKYDSVPSVLAKLSLSGKQQNVLMKGLNIDASKRYSDALHFLYDFTGNAPQGAAEATSFEVSYFARTDIGKREVNQDNFMIDSCFRYAGEDCVIDGKLDINDDALHIAAIADGVANAGYSEFASKAAIQAVSHFLDAYRESDTLPEILLEDLLNQVNEKVVSLSAKLGLTASTISILVWKRDSYYVANIGDSPIFLLSGNRLTKLTGTHTLAERKKETGENITPSDLHTLTSYLGKKSIAGAQMAAFYSGTIRSGDTFLLCSDGVSNTMNRDTLRHVLKSAQKDGKKTIASLWKHAQKDAKMDNCTAIVLTFR